MSAPQQAPGPRGLPIVGILPLLLGDRLGRVLKLQARYGDVVRLRVGTRRHHLFCHPDHIQHVLAGNASNFSKGRTFAKTSAYLGQGLATSSGELWKKQRRVMQPQFHREALADLADIMVRGVQSVAERWERAAHRDEPVDVSRDMQGMAMDVVARTLFGYEVPEENVREIVTAIRVALHHTTKRVINPIDIPDRWPTRGNLRFKKALATLDSAVGDIIRTQRSAEAPTATLLSMMLHATDPETGEGMSDQQLQDEIMTLFLGGTDTSGNTLTWVFYVLDRYPELRERLLEELSAAGTGDAPRAESLEHLDFTTRLVQETLRLFPQNWVMSRDTIADDEIGGYHIPGGTTVFLGIYATHRHADFWDEPSRFDPDRFTEARSAGRHRFAYLPFGGGQRKCLGYAFAMMEATLALALLVPRFSVELLDPEVRPHPKWSLAPRGGLWARLRPKGR